eukprot:5053123-Pyramimonas_sp.AAC.1
MVEALLDLEKFFDSVELEWMVHSALRLNYPTPPLALALMVHRCTRVLTSAIGCSDFAVPDKSMLQGCGQ